MPLPAAVVAALGVCVTWRCSWSQDHQLGAAEIDDVGGFTPLLTAYPWLLSFVNPGDEARFTVHLWHYVRKKQAVATTLALAAIVCIMGLVVTPFGVYDDALTILVFILGQLVPVIAMLIWLFMPSRMQPR